MITPGNFLVVSSNPTNVGRGRLLLQGQDVIVNITNKKELDLSEDSVAEWSKVPTQMWINA